MSDAYNRDEALELIHGHLEQSLTAEEASRLEALLSRHEGARKDLLVAAALHQELFNLHEAPPVLVTNEASPADSQPPALPVKRLTSPRSIRRVSRGVRELPWAQAAAAAAVLIGLAFLAFALAGGDSGVSKRHHDSARGKEDPAPPRRESTPPEDAEAERALEEKIRTEGLRRLAELERRRLDLVKAAPPQTPDSPPQERSTQRDLGLLEAEKRQIEEEMKDAIARAAKNYRDRSVAPAADHVETAPPGPLVPAPSGPVAQVEHVEGLAFLVRAETKLPLREGLEILPGDGLEGLGDASRIQIRFPDKTRLDLKGETLLSELAE